MEVLISNNSSIHVNLDFLRELAEFVLSSENADSDAELSILLADEDEMQRLNSKYRGIDAPTDVLSFPQAEDHCDGPHLLGDVVISPQVAQSQAESLNHSFEREMTILLVHGILHLLGYDHEMQQDVTVMQEAEQRILGEFSRKEME